MNSFYPMSLDHLERPGVPFGILRWRKRLERQRDLVSLKRDGAVVGYTCRSHCAVTRAFVEADGIGPVEEWGVPTVKTRPGGISKKSDYDKDLLIDRHYRPGECSLCEGEWALLDEAEGEIDE